MAERMNAGAIAITVALAASVASGATHAQQLQKPARAVAKKTVNCSKPPYRNKIRGTLAANVEITLYPTLCVVTGRVKGNVTVRSTDRRCARAADYVALSLRGGTIDGRVNAAGKQCVMVWLFDGGLVKGRIDYRAAGKLPRRSSRGPCSRQCPRQEWPPLGDRRLDDEPRRREPRL
jgi:hypothetical protein